MYFGPASPDAGVELLRQLFLQCGHIRPSFFFSISLQNITVLHLGHLDLCSGRSNVLTWCFVYTFCCLSAWICTHAAYEKSCNKKKQKNTLDEIEKWCTLKIAASAEVVHIASNERKSVKGLRHESEYVRPIKPIKLSEWKPMIFNFSSCLAEKVNNNNILQASLKTLTNFFVGWLSFSAITQKNFCTEKSLFVRCTADIYKWVLQYYLFVFCGAGSLCFRTRTWMYLFVPFKIASSLYVGGREGYRVKWNFSKFIFLTKTWTKSMACFVGVMGDIFN